MRATTIDEQQEIYAQWRACEVPDFYDSALLSRVVK